MIIKSLHGMISSIVLLLHHLLIPFSNCEVSVLNAGVGGNNTADLLERVENDVISQKPDIVIMMVGTNDMFWIKKRISYDQYASNLDTLIGLFKSNNIEVLLVSPPPADTSYLFERHDRELFVELPNKKLEVVSEILRTKSAQNNLLFVDIFNQFKKKGIPDHNKDNIIRNEFNSGAHDGVHPTPQGYRMIADKIFKKLLDNGKIEEGIKIICFGDSITLGAHVVGEGTASGETYPAYLKERICQHLNS